MLLQFTRRRPAVLYDSCEWAEIRDPLKLASVATSQLALANLALNWPP